MAMNQRTMRPKKAAAAAVTYHAEALAWKTAAEANGGTVSTPTLAAVSTFCAAIDAAGIRDRFLRLSLVCGSDLAAARTPLYRGASLTGTQYGSAADVNNGPFVSGDYSESTGLNPNGSTKYFDTTVTAGSLGSFGANGDNVHAAVYNIDATSGGQFGGADENGSLDNAYVACLLDASNSTQSKPFFTVSGYFVDGWVYGAGNAGGPGFWVGESLSNATGQLTKNGVNVTAGYAFDFQPTYTSSDTMPLYFCAGWSPVGNYYANGHLSAYSVGKAFTSSAQRTAYYTAMQAFQTALGRNV